MEKENLRFSTSTPMRVKITGKENLQQKRSRKSGTDDIASQPRKFTKENRRKSAPIMRQKQDRAAVEKREAKRRELALESMQILEKRRLRLIQNEIHEDTVVDELANFSLSMSPISPEEEKKRNHMKELKRQRILEALAEQEARKNSAKPTEKPQSSFVSRPKVWPTRRQTRRVNFDLPLINDEEPEVQNPQKFTRHIKYSLDELRSLNPYGYYFMWISSLRTHLFFYRLIWAACVTLLPLSLSGAYFVN